jgi:hypothetical protein
MCNTTRQLQAIIASLEDSRFINKDIFITYMDFENGFGSIDHARLLAIMIDLGYSHDAVELMGNICCHSTSSFKDI